MELCASDLQHANELRIEDGRLVVQPASLQVQISQTVQLADGLKPIGAGGRHEIPRNAELCDMRTDQVQRINHSDSPLDVLVAVSRQSELQLPVERVPQGVGERTARRGCCGPATKCRRCVPKLPVSPSPNLIRPSGAAR